MIYVSNNNYGHAFKYKGTFTLLSPTGMNNGSFPHYVSQFVGKGRYNTTIYPEAYIPSTIPTVRNSAILRSVSPVSSETYMDLSTSCLGFSETSGGTKVNRNCTRFNTSSLAAAFKYNKATVGGNNISGTFIDTACGCLLDTNNSIVDCGGAIVAVAGHFYGVSPDVYMTLPYIGENSTAGSDEQGMAYMIGQSTNWKNVDTSTYGVQGTPIYTGSFTVNGSQFVGLTLYRFNYSQILLKSSINSNPYVLLSPPRIELASQGAYNITVICLSSWRAISNT